MNIKHVILLTVCTSLLPVSSLAFSLLPDGVTVSYGKYFSLANDRVAKYDNTRIGLNWHINESLYQQGNFSVNGYFELAGSSWKSRLENPDAPAYVKDEAWAVSFSPVIRLTSAAPIWGSASPLLDIGVGAAWLSEQDLQQDHISGINLGGHLQFELRLLAGFSFGDRQQYDIRYGWFHYSNANLYKINEAIDFHTINLGWRW